MDIKGISFSPKMPVGPSLSANLCGTNRTRRTSGTAGHGTRIWKMADG